MSHFTRIATQIKDREALQAAVSKMGFLLNEHSKARYYYGAEMADLVVKLPGKYDIALNLKNEEYEVKADMYDGEVSRYVGKNAGILLQQYSAEKVKIEAFQRGLSVTENEEKGMITLTLTDEESGGQISVVCYSGGKTEIKTSGFPGQGCMKFRDLDEALGSTESFKETMEMYLPERNEGYEYVNNYYVEEE